jgi:hypothetical protein
MTDQKRMFHATEHQGRLGLWIDGWTALAIVGLIFATKIIDAIIASYPS